MNGHATSQVCWQHAPEPSQMQAYFQRLWSGLKYYPANTSLSLGSKSDIISVLLSGQLHLLAPCGWAAGAKRGLAELFCSLTPVIMLQSESSTSAKLQVVAGVLTKHVNIAKGWRDRLFVLDGDQLYYYKARIRALQEDI